MTGWQRHTTARKLFKVLMLLLAKPSEQLGIGFSFLVSAERCIRWLNQKQQIISGITN